FDAPAENPIHQDVGADVDQWIAPVAKIEDAAMFQEPIDNRYHANIFAHARKTWPESANAPTDHVDFHSRLAGAIQGLDHFRLVDAVDLGDDPSFTSPALDGRLAFDLFNHERLQAAGS